VNRVNYRPGGRRLDVDQIHPSDRSRRFKVSFGFVNQESWKRKDEESYAAHFPLTTTELNSSSF